MGWCSRAWSCGAEAGRRAREVRARPLDSSRGDPYRSPRIGSRVPNHESPGLRAGRSSETRLLFRFPDSSSHDPARHHPFRAPHVETASHHHHALRATQPRHQPPGARTRVAVRAGQWRRHDVRRHGVRDVTRPASPRSDGSTPTPPALPEPGGVSCFPDDAGSHVTVSRAEGTRLPMLGDTPASPHTKAPGAHRGAHSPRPGGGQYPTDTRADPAHSARHDDASRSTFPPTREAP